MPFLILSNTSFNQQMSQGTDHGLCQSTKLDGHIQSVALCSHSESQSWVNTKFMWNDTLTQNFEKLKLILINKVKDSIQPSDVSRKRCFQTNWFKKDIGYLLLHNIVVVQLQKLPSVAQMCRNSYSQGQSSLMTLRVEISYQKWKCLSLPGGQNMLKFLLLDVQNWFYQQTITPIGDPH